MTRTVQWRVHAPIRWALVFLALAVFAPSELAAQCVGDCDPDGQVRISEVQRCVNIRTGTQTLPSCQAADQNLDKTVSEAEVEACIAAFLDASDCPRVFTPAQPTGTATSPPPSTATVPPPPTNTSPPPPTNTSPPPPTSTPTQSRTPTVALTQTPTRTPTTPPTVTQTATPGAHRCAFNEATDNSDFDLRVQGNASLGSLVGPIAGAVDITCGAPGGNGKRACTCVLQTWTPVNIIGIGFACIFPAVCPAGEQDCDGGNALGIDAYDDSQIGSCTSHADCSTSCDSFCAGLSRVQWRSGCENFCQGGTRDGLACICDAVGSSGCIGGVAGVDDCPSGSCVGKNNEADRDCQCQCVNYAAGGASDPGDIRCNLGADIKIVNTPPCANPALVDLPPVCAPLTSQQTTGLTTDANEGGSSTTIGPNTTTGSPETCANVDASVTTGFTLATDIGFADSTIGDLRALLTLDCQ